MTEGPRAWTWTVGDNFLGRASPSPEHPDSKGGDANSSKETHIHTRRVPGGGWHPESSVSPSGGAAATS